MTSCVCKEMVFCKKCYSKLYYEKNKQNILTYQKQKYKNNKKEKNKWVMKRGEFIVSFS